MNIRTQNAALTLLAILSSTPGAYALNVAGPTYGGAGISGVNNSATLATFGATRQNSGTAANINDGSLTTRVDTFWNITPNPNNYSFVGIQWPFLRADSVKTLTFTMACFGDGGWFGFNVATPGAGNPLNSVSHLIEPSVQVTTDFGTTWTAVDATSDYLTQLEGHNIGGTGATGTFPNPNPKTFTVTLDTPVSGINGIRLIGENGGPADGNGFLGIFELAVDAGPVVDADADGMEDSWEEAHGGMANLTLTSDLDTDGLTDVNEFLANVDPQDVDSDNDGLNDGPEVLTHQTNPGDADTDDDTLSDGAEVTTHMTNPRLADTDADGLSDSAEINTHLTGPTDFDSDDDGYSDGLEVLTFFTNPLSAASRIANIARAGNGLTGVNNAADADNGTLVANAGTIAGTSGSNSRNINDGSLTTRVDTFNASAAFSYVGIRWATPWTLPVARLELTLATFLDGGWFGPNGVGPGAGGALVDPTHLTVPIIQVTTDAAGNVWATVPGTVTDNYLSQMTGHLIGGGGVVNPSSRKVVFTLDTPIANIRGIRIIGREGGTVGGGFLGVFELAIQDTSTANDLDGDGLLNSQEITLGTNPEDDDSDDDGLLDGAEVNTHLSNPLDVDSDDDQFRDGAEVAASANPASALSFPSNVALIGTGIMGLNDAIDTDAGTPFVHAGTGANINDGNPLTPVDTWNGAAGGGINSFAGVVWSSPQTVKAITFTFATFFDGGWFGVNAIDPGAGGPLDSTYLVEPTVQVSTDGGVTWTNAAHTSDYLSALDGHNIGGGAFPNPSSKSATFTLTDAASGVTGVRIIGQEGGTASQGFLGCFEIAVSQGGVAGDMDNDGLPDAWEVSNFGYVHAQHLRGDPDRDGSDNLLERGFGMNPNSADQPPAGILEDGYLTMTISKVPGIAYTVLSGSDLTGFTTTDTTVLINDPSTLKVRDNTLISVGPRRLLKTTVSPAP